MVDKVRRKEKEVPVVSGSDRFHLVRHLHHVSPEMLIVSGPFIDWIKNDLYRI